MRKYFNYTTNKLYESEGIVYKIDVKLEALEGASALSVDDLEDELLSRIGEPQNSNDEAVDMLYCALKDLQKDFGFDIHDIDCEDDGSYVLVVPDVAICKFTIVPANEGASVETEVETEGTLESVSQRFAKLRALYESEDEENISEKKGDDSSDDEGKGDDEEKSDDEKSDDEGKEGDKEGKGDDEDDDEGKGDEDEEAELTGIELTVAKDDADKCKEELIDAGIPEEDIEIVEGEDDDDEAKIVVDASSAVELKEYLAKKGIDLEEKIGGEIVDTDEDSDEDEGGEGDSDENGEEKENDDEDFDFENIGDLFGAEE